MDFEGARRNADERLNQELIRIRNLPKRSKIKIVNKYGLKHASHTNAGLLKDLEINLGVISREQRRVANECSKRQRDFAEVQRKALSKLFLPPLEQEEQADEKPEIKRKPQRPRRTTASVFDQTPEWLRGRRQSITEKKREILLDMTAKSKERTFQIISENNKKTSIGVPLPPLRDVEVEEDAWITRLHRQRKNAFAGSCFPFLLAEDKEFNKDQDKYRGQKVHQNQQGLHSLPKNDDAHLKKRTFRGTVYEKVIKMPDPAKIPHLNPRDPKLYHVVMKVHRKRKVSKLENSDAVVARKNTVFTRHWK